MDSIIGTWRLEEIQLVDESSEIFHPLGKEVRGMLIYKSDGYMSGIISGENRPDVNSHAVIGLSDEERAAIARNFIAYAGSYTCDNEKVIHKVEVSFIPNLMHASEHSSNYRFEGTSLIMSSDVQKSNEGTRKSINLIWNRV